MPPASSATALDPIIPELELRAEAIRRAWQRGVAPLPGELAALLDQARRAARELKGESRERAARVCAGLTGLALDLARQGLTAFLEI